MVSEHTPSSRGAPPTGERSSIPNPVAVALHTHLTASPSAPAFADANDRELTYLDLWRTSQGIASQLRSLPTGGVTTVVAVVSSTAGLLDYVSAYFGALLAGYCVVTLPADACMEDGASSVITPDIVVDARPGADRKTPLPELGPTSITIDELRDTAHPDAIDPQANEIDQHAPAEILFTSGTTGLRKGVVLEYGNIADDLNHERWARRRRRGSVLHALAFGGTPAQSMLLEPLRPYGYLVRAIGPDVDAFVRTARRIRPTSTVLVPAQAKRIAEFVARSGGDPLSTFRSVRIMSAPILPEELRYIAAAFPNATVTNLYSSTESWPAAIALHQVGRRSGSTAADRSATRARIVSADGKPLPRGSVGHVELERPYKAHHYLAGRNEDGSLRVSTITTERGWIRTGDIGRLDDGRQLQLLGRADDLLNIGGSKVAPSAIERVVREAAGVDEAVAIGLPHPTLGQYVGIIVTPRRADRAGIRRHAFDRLPRQYRPRRIICVDSIPRTPQGKLDRRALERLFSDEPDERDGIR
jgi:acyl-CoA synthetase (AMP-forming)/AMP-acid ligase II